MSRPHRALAARTSAEFAGQIAASRDLTEPKTGQELTYLTGAVFPGPSSCPVSFFSTGTIQAGQTNWIDVLPLAKSAVTYQFPGLIAYIVWVYPFEPEREF